VGMNYLTGSLPDEWASHLGSLDSVDLRSNQLEGEFPTSWAAQIMTLIASTATIDGIRAARSRPYAVLLANNTCLCGAISTDIAEK
jgi:hypothetical protein